MLEVPILHVKSQLWGSVCSKPAQMIQERSRSLSATLKHDGRTLAGGCYAERTMRNRESIGPLSRDSDFTYLNYWRRIWAHNSRKELAKSLPKENRCVKRLKKRARD